MGDLAPAVNFTARVSVLCSRAGRRHRALRGIMPSRPAIERPNRRAARSARPAAADTKALDAVVATWPGPAARLDGHGEVVQANQAASVLLDEVTARAGRDGLAALVTSVQDGPARTATIVIAPDRVSLTYDLWIVPLPRSP